MASNDCLFCKIVQKEIQSDIVYEDEHVIAFKDIQPQAPLHLLIIPRQHISSLTEVTKQDRELLGHIQWVATHLAEKHGVASSGYRTVYNCGDDGQQSVYHIHLHLLGGRGLQWPPG